MPDKPIIFKDAVEREFWTRIVCALLVTDLPDKLWPDEVADDWLRAFRKRRHMEPPDGA